MEDTCEEDFYFRAELSRGFLSGCYCLGTADASLRTSLANFLITRDTTPSTVRIKECSMCACVCGGGFTNVSISPISEPLISWDGDVGHSTCLLYNQAIPSNHLSFPSLLSGTAFSCLCPATPGRAQFSRSTVTPLLFCAVDALSEHRFLLRLTHTIGFFNNPHWLGKKMESCKSLGLHSPLPQCGRWQSQDEDQSWQLGSQTKQPALDLRTLSSHPQLPVVSVVPQSPAEL